MIRNLQRSLFFFTERWRWRKGQFVSENEDFQKLPYEVPFFESVFIFTDKSVGQVQVSHLRVR